MRSDQAHGQTMNMVVSWFAVRVHMYTHIYIHMYYKYTVLKHKMNTKSLTVFFFQG